MYDQSHQLGSRRGTLEVLSIQELVSGSVELHQVIWGKEACSFFKHLGGLGSQSLRVQEEVLWERIN